MHRLALLAAALLVAVLACELALRAGGYHAPVWHRADPLLGWTLRPGMAGPYRIEGRSDVRISAAGFRDLDHLTLKPPGVYRIAVLGDSYSEAMHVPMDSTYWARLPPALAGCGFAAGRAVEVLNFGVSGYSTAQELLTLPRALQYRPDLVLVQVTVSNDIRNNGIRLEPTRRTPFFVPAEDGGIRLNDSVARSGYAAQQGLTRRAFRSLSGLRLVQLLYAAHDARRQAAPPGEAPIQRFGGMSRLDLPVFAPPADAAWNEAWMVTERMLLAIRDSGAVRGIPVVLALVASPVTVSPSLVARSAMAESLGVADLLYPERRLLAFGRAHDLRVFALGPAMAAHAAATRTSLHGFDDRLDSGHWNAAGHRVAASIIADSLCRTGLASPQR